MKVSIDLDSADAAELKRARAMLDKLATDVCAMTKDRRALLRTPAADLDLSKRTINALAAQGVVKISDLVALKAAKLRTFPNIGNYSVNEIRAALALLDLDLTPNERGRPMSAITKED